MLIVAFVVVTVGSQMLVSDASLVAGKEIAFAVVGQQALGAVGLWLATVAAVFSTTSAINATLFSTARLVQTVSDANEMPARLGRQRRDVPAVAIIWLAAAGVSRRLLPAITELVAFGSLAFLVVFGMVNLMHAHHTARPGLDRALALIAATGCALAGAFLIYYLARVDRLALC